MKGRVLDFKIQSNSGIISGDDGNRYSFQGSEWKENTTPSRGLYVDFDVDGQNAVGIYTAAIETTQGRNTWKLIGFSALWAFVFLFVIMFLTGMIAGALNPENPQFARARAGEALGELFFVLSIILSAILTALGKLPGTKS